MSEVAMHHAVPPDGFIADPDDQAGPPVDRYSDGDAEPDVVGGSRRCPPTTSGRCGQAPGRWGSGATCSTVERAGRPPACSGPAVRSAVPAGGSGRV
ncbi:hypothetical protein GCM10027162_47600 [Streptomyces incanus]